MTESSAALLTVAQMGQADRMAAAYGLPGHALMARAGAAVASEIRRRWPPCPAVVLCGPGNNGGDGFVAARLLAEAGFSVTLGLLGERAALHGDAAHHAALWHGEVAPLSPRLVDGATLVIDAVFGAGLSRPVEGVAREALRASSGRLVAIDVPSGVHGDTGADMGATAAQLTVTFFRKKPGHLLLPGRTLCGELVVADIGIPPSVLGAIAPDCVENTPALWRDAFPPLDAGTQKFARGHALIVGGEVMTGAARMAARAAARAGAGLTSLAVPERAWPVYAAALTSIMVRPLGTEDEFSKLLADTRITAMLIGPGAGVHATTRAHALAMLATSRPVLLDADAITVFKPDPDALFAAIAGPCVLTPHEGEFSRLFQLDGDKLARARGAAAQSGAVIVLKGSDTIVASPDGRNAINANAPPTLATAGAGDVLGGFIAGLLAQGMPAFESSCAGVWLHGAAASSFGPGLLAEDLPDLLPNVLRDLAKQAAETETRGGEYVMRTE